MKVCKNIIVLVIVITACSKENSNPSTTKGPYFAKVKSIIKANCTISCHSPSKGFFQGLPVILDNDTDIIIRAASIKAAVAGPFNFMTNKQMPLGGKLTSSDIELISKWADEGGKAMD